MKSLLRVLKFFRAALENTHNHLRVEEKQEEEAMHVSQLSFRNAHNNQKRTTPKGIDIISINVDDQLLPGGEVSVLFQYKNVLFPVKLVVLLLPIAGVFR